MAVFTLTAHDPDEDYDDVPESLLPLGKWLDGRRDGTIAWEIDPYEGVGVLLDDGTEQFVEPSWGAPEPLAVNCRVAAKRLSRSEVALLRSAILDAGSYLLFAPRGDTVRVARIDRTPPGGDVFPFSPSPRAHETQADVDALYAWAEASAEQLLAPSRNVAADRARGKGLHLPLSSLIANLRHSAEVAQALIDGVSPPTSASDSHSGTAARVHAPATSSTPVIVESVPQWIHEVNLIRSMRGLGGMTINAARAAYLEVVGGTPVRLEFTDRAEAEAFCTEIGTWGAVTRIE